MYAWHATRYENTETPWRVIRDKGDSGETVWGHYATLNEAKDAAEYANVETARLSPPTPPAAFSYERWRHGGWYVNEVRYPSGACGCVSRNYADHKWRIACDPRPFETAPTFKSRDEAALAEWHLANGGVALTTLTTPNLPSAVRENTDATNTYAGACSRSGDAL